MTNLGVIFPPDLPPERLMPVARAADAAGVAQLWVWEDCFREAGIASATAALAVTDRLVLGIGLMPAPLRNVALTAMEIATVERMFPGRFLPGIGHGVLDWMAQVGARAASPMTLLREYTQALRALLHGQTVTVSGRSVSLTDVTLDWPPPTPPPLLVGAIKPRTVSLAGELSDGVIFTGDAGPATIRESLAHFRSGRDLATTGGLGETVVAFLPTPGTTPAPQIARRITEYADAGRRTSSCCPSEKDHRWRTSSAWWASRSGPWCSPDRSRPRLTDAVVLLRLPLAALAGPVADDQPDDRADDTQEHEDGPEPDEKVAAGAAGDQVGDQQHDRPDDQDDPGHLFHRVPRSSHEGR